MFRIRFTLLLLSLLFSPFFTSAAEKIVVNPAFQELALDAHQSIVGEIEIQNQTTSDQVFTVRSVSFDALDTSGGVAFLGADINDESLPLAPFIFLETTDLSVPAGATAKFPFQVRDLPNLSPGGHYAALIFQSLPVTDEDSNQKVAVRQIFSSLIFLEKKGGAIKDLELQNFPDRHFLFFLPSTEKLQFRNKGNTHLVPRGTVSLKNVFGRTETCAVLNESSSILLPGQERDFVLALKCQTIWPGPTTLLVSYRYDGKEEMIVASDSFFLLPYQFIFIGGAGVVLLLFLKKKNPFLRK